MDILHKHIEIEQSHFSGIVNTIWYEDDLGKNSKEEKENFTH